MKILNVYKETIYEDNSHSQQETVQNAVQGHVRLDFANLRGWDLSGVILTEVSLRYADMYKVNMQGVHIYESSLYGAYMRGANLRGGKFYEVDFHKANLWSAALHGANLTGSTDIYQFGPIGENARMGYAVNWGNEVMIQLGCFWGGTRRSPPKSEGKIRGQFYLRAASKTCRRSCKKEMLD